MLKLLVKTFVPDYENTKNPSVRESYGRLAGLVGICSNGILCTLKLIIGALTGSIAILADGINNLTDASSSLITLIGFRLASRPSDEEHPYGHARIEYITGLIVSMLIIVLGIQLFGSSVEKILHPDPLEFNYVIVGILIFAIGVKIWQALFNIKIGERINSTTLKATGMDSRNDVIATSGVLISVVAGKLTGIQLDGIMGGVVALFIVYSGIQLIRETSSPLLGQAPDPELIQGVQEMILSHEGALGIHDLVVHDYGPGRIFASAHVEVDAHGDLLKSHDLIDDIERKVNEAFKLQLVVHMDPLETKDPLTNSIHERVQEIAHSFPGVIDIHDFRLVAGYSHSNLIFDIVVPQDFKMKESELKEQLQQRIREELGESYFIVVTVDRSYVRM